MILESEFKKKYKDSNCVDICWLNRTNRDNNDYMLIVTDTFSYEEYPVFCKSYYLVDNIEKYNNQSNMSKVQEVVKLEKKEKINTNKSSEFCYTVYGERVKLDEDGLSK